MPSPKEILRREIRKQLRDLSPALIAEHSRKIRDLLRFAPGTRVALFAGTRYEPALLDLCTQPESISWFLPKITGPGEMEFFPVSRNKQLVPGPFGILEPPDGEPTDDLDVIICPGLAFTRDGHRLGQGGGYYDRALARFPKARKVAVAFPCQIVPVLPHEPHDAMMDAVITPIGEP
jgi:5-formyltetrahydrofolate cyclo-ligase